MGSPNILSATLSSISQHCEASTLVKNLELRENRFGFEPEITAKLAKTHCRIYEVGISYSGRTYSEGKKVNWKDGIRAIYAILRYNLFP